MPRILVEETWYEQVEPSTLSELVFQDRISLHAPLIYPHYYVIPFNKTLTAPSESNSREYYHDRESPDGDELTGDSNVLKVRADLAFVAKDYSEWSVVEVEMGYHSFNGHVKPQIETLLRASYGRDEAEYLCSKVEGLDVGKMYHMIQYMPMSFLIILNQNKPEWSKWLSERRIKIITFELFRSKENKEIFLVDGTYTSNVLYKVSDCEFHPTIPRLLGIRSPESYFPQGSHIDLVFNNCLTSWEVIHSQSSVWITATRRDPLNTKYRYSIYLLGDGRLLLRQEEV